MADTVDTATRRRMMSGIRGKNTTPELQVRKILFARGFRYRLHGKKLPGKPDLVFPKYNAVILVHGCFWHRHECHLFKWPSTRREFWQAKLDGNVERDRKNESELRRHGWRIATVWECALKGKNRLNQEALADHLACWLKSDKNDVTIQASSNLVTTS